MTGLLKETNILRILNQNHILKNSSNLSSVGVHILVKLIN